MSELRTATEFFSGPAFWGAVCAHLGGGDYADYDVALISTAACPSDDDARPLLEKEFESVAWEPDEMVGFVLARMWVRSDPVPCDEDWPWELLHLPAEGSAEVWVLMPSGCYDPLQFPRRACNYSDVRPMCQQVRCAVCDRSGEELRSWDGGECGCDSHRQRQSWLKGQQAA